MPNLIIMSKSGENRSFAREVSVTALEKIWRILVPQAP